MCDTIVSIPPRSAFPLLAKNSDREPGEAQLVEHRPAARHPAGARLRATWIEIDQAGATHEVVLSRPAWMWGAEMGVNEHGLAIGNEAVFTRVPVARVGLTGMDLVRIALERARDADDALEQITWRIARHGQGGRCGHRDARFRYHNAFVIADPRSAWLLETAGPYWAAVRVDGARTASNVLSIGRPDRAGPGTAEEARRRGWLAPGEELDFARAFGDPLYRVLSGGETRRACSARALGRTVDRDGMARALRDHAGHAPESGTRMLMPCAHASWLPTRWAGQTTASMLAELRPDGPRVLMTGTSSPCLSVLKPVPLGGDPVDTGPPPGPEGGDRSSLFWRHERLHRIVLRAYDRRRAVFEEERLALESRALDGHDARRASEIWREHREQVLDWVDRARGVGAPALPRVFDLFWSRQSRRDGLAL